MISAIVFYFVQLLVLQPFQAEITDRLMKANVPFDVIANVNSCAVDAGQLITARASADPWQLVSMGFEIWVRGVAPDRVLTAAVPSCGPPIETAKSFLARQSA